MKVKVRQPEATRAALVAAARELFAERGYAGVGTEEIVQRAGVTRGALYHHFNGKEDLLRAVLHDLARELAEASATAALKETDQWRQILAAVDAFLDACVDPAVQQIMMTDAPSVLGLGQDIDAAEDPRDVVDDLAPFALAGLPAVGAAEVGR
jgi:AcrR family transcriptional regulator